MRRPHRPLSLNIQCFMKTIYLTIALAATSLGSLAQNGPYSWKFSTEGRFVSAPALFEKTLLAGNANGHLYAVDISTGTERWKFKTGKAIGTQPCIAANSAIFGSYDGHYYAVDARTGKLRWRFKTGGERKIGGKGLWTLQPLSTYMEDPMISSSPLPPPMVRPSTSAAATAAYMP